MQEGKNARKMRWKTMRNTLHYDEKISQKKSNGKIKGNNPRQEIRISMRKMYRLEIGKITFYFIRD